MSFLYIPLSSDKTEYNEFVIDEVEDLYIPLSSDKTLMAYASYLDLRTLYPTKFR